MRFLFLPLFLSVLASCSTSRLSVPEVFSSQATCYRVKGANVTGIFQKLQFGDYKTSRIKRGWYMSSGISYNIPWISPEEVLLGAFNIDMMHERNNEKGKFRYTLENKMITADIFASEAFQSRDIVLQNNNPWKWAGETSLNLNYKYAFSAAIIPRDTARIGTWSMLMINKYDITRDTARHIFQRPYVEEEGYATNGKDTIRIRPLNVANIVSKSGKESKVLFGAKILSGYELSTNDGVIGIIDTLDKSIWLYNDQEEDIKFVLSSMATAILLKAIENPENKGAI